MEFSFLRFLHADFAPFQNNHWIAHQRQVKGNFLFNSRYQFVTSSYYIEFIFNDEEMTRKLYVDKSRQTLFSNSFR